MQFEGSLDEVTISEDDGGMVVGFDGLSEKVDISFGEVGNHPVIDFQNGLTVELIEGSWCVFVDGQEYIVGQESSDTGGSVEQDDDDPVRDADASADSDVDPEESKATSTAATWPMPGHPFNPAPTLSSGNGFGSTLISPPPLVKGR